MGEPAAGSIFTVTVSPTEPNRIAAATADAGIIVSSDGGQTWNETPSPRKAMSVAFSASDSNVVYAACGTDGIYKSVDKGQTWTSASAGIDPACTMKDVAVSPANANDVFAIGAINWGGFFFTQTMAARRGQRVSSLTTDPIYNPTLPQEAVDGKAVPLSNPTNIAVNPPTRRN